MAKLGWLFLDCVLIPRPMSTLVQEEHIANKSTREVGMKHQTIPLHRLLFLARPPAFISERIKQEAVRWGDCVRHVRADLYHLTLAVTDDYSAVPTGMPERLCHAGASVVAEPFPLVLDRLVGTHMSAALRPSSPVAPLKRLQKSIEGAMRTNGIKRREGYRFSPHLTLFYRDGEPTSALVDGFGWRVDEFILVDSHVGHSHHEVLGRWKLRGSGEAQYRLL